MYCPLKEFELDVDVCPVKCIYRRTDGTCAHNELAYDENLTHDEVARILILPVEEVKRRAERAQRRIKIAMVVDAYLGYSNPQSVNTVVEKKEHPIFRLFNLPRTRLKAVLNKERYEKWREMAKVDVTFEDIRDLFMSVIKPAKGN
jgi:hypothetical protein